MKLINSPVAQNSGTLGCPQSALGIAAAPFSGEISETLCPQTMLQCLLPHGAGDNQHFITPRQNGDWIVVVRLWLGKKSLGNTISKAIKFHSGVSLQKPLLDVRNYRPDQC